MITRISSLSGSITVNPHLVNTNREVNEKEWRDACSKPDRLGIPAGAPVEEVAFLKNLEQPYQN